MIDAGSCTRGQVGREDVLRILSWNTFNLPTIAGEMGQINMDERDRGRLVARLLKRSPYQVIALNEVFDETVRDALIEEAESGSDAFQFVVEDIDGGGMEDSGLVVLSRLEPVRFPAPAPAVYQHGGPVSLPGVQKPFEGTSDYLDTRHCASMDVWWKGQPNDGEVDSWISGNENCLVAFHRYRACTSETPSGSPFGSECDAGKGVAYVRLRQTNGRELDVFWSHTQATLRTPEYDVPLPKFEKQRRKQLEELAAMVARWSPPLARDVVILGDLNVDGNRAPLGKDEYLQLLAPGSSLLGKMGFRDLWPESAPKNDFGLTYSHRNDHVPTNFPEERLDYVLWRDRDALNSCAQHTFVERKFDLVRPGGATIDLSDHYGIGVELRSRNTDLPQGEQEPCSPSLAKEAASLLSHEMKGRLHVPGACHWLYFKPGTYTVTSFTTDPLLLTAWKALDISESTDFFRGDGELHHMEKQDEAQVFLDEPFYLKICWMDGTRTGDYRISVSPNVGADPQHPIVLTLNRPTQASYGSQFGSNPNNLLWALVKIPKTFSESPHAMQAELSPTGFAALRVGTAEVGASSPAISWTGGFASDWGVKPIGSFGGPAEKEMFIVVERQQLNNPAQQVFFGLRPITDHQEVRLDVLECIEQEDSTGDDHIRMTYSADGKVLKIVDLGDFDEGQDVNLSTHSQLGVNWVRGEVRVTIYDQDGTDLENDVTSGNALDNLGTIVIEQFTGPLPTGGQVKSDSGKFTQDGANYRLDYRRKR
jgi:endonuclease/exonuclease/phosphatase family metal-dependent hydrolase